MIYDGLSAISRYRGLYKGLDVLIDWLGTHELGDMPIGRVQVEGDKVFANVMDARTRTYEQARYEVHHHYMDLQADIEGVECFKVTPGAVVPLSPFDEVTDKGYYECASDNDDELYGTLADGHFALFVVDEPHMPNLVAPGAEVGPIRKVCFKILADDLWED